MSAGVSYRASSQRSIKIITFNKNFIHQLMLNIINHTCIILKLSNAGNGWVISFPAYMGVIAILV